MVTPSVEAGADVPWSPTAGPTSAPARATAARRGQSAAGGRRSTPGAPPPLDAHAARGEPPPDRDPVAILAAQETTRVGELIAVRHERMGTSAFAFFRGAAAVFAADLARTPTTSFTVQLCGDAHLSNFGGYAAPDRKLVFDVNDFDETLPGPFEWDVKRLAASLVIAGRAREFRRKQARQAAVAAVRRYREAMRELAEMGELDVWYSRVDETGLVKEWARLGDRPEVRALRRGARRQAEKAATKDSTRAYRRLTEIVDGEPRFVSDPPLIVPLHDFVGEHRPRALELFDAVFASYRKSLPADVATLVGRFELVDVARKVVGVGSVGTRCLIALFLGRHRSDPLVLQVKEAQASVLEPYLGASRYPNAGRRVVEGQRLMQTASDPLLGWVRANGADGVARDYYVRQLWDGKVSAEIEGFDPPMLAVYGELCGWTLARAHARSGDRLAIAAYLGATDAFEEAVADFAEGYAAQNDEDYRTFLAATTRA